MKKRLKFLLTRLALTILFVLGKILRKNQLKFIARLCGTICYFLPLKKKNISMRNIKIAFEQDYKDRDLKKILKDFIFEIFLLHLHISHIISKKQPLQNWAEAIGLEHLEDALKKGNGVIALSGHLGNFPLMIAWLAERGYPVAVLYKEVKYFPKNFLFNLISYYKIYPIPFTSDREVPIKIIKALNHGMIVFMLSDQSRPGVYTNFFGKLTQSQKGAYILSKRKGSPIIPIFIVREEDKYKILIYPELKLKNNQSNKVISDEQIIFLVQKYNSLLESLIRKYPSQYYWFYRRFKQVKSQ